VQPLQYDDERRSNPAAVQGQSTRAESAAVPGNLPGPGAPIIRVDDAGERRVELARWGVPPAPGGSVPEPQVWNLLITGLGLVGVQMRRRSRQTAVSA